MATSVLGKKKEIRKKERKERKGKKKQLKMQILNLEELSSAVIERCTCGAVDCATGGRGASGHEP